MVDRVDVNSLKAQRDPLYRVIFATNAKLRANEDEFVIKFAFVDETNGEYSLVEQISVVITPAHAERLHRALGRNIEQRIKAIASGEGRPKKANKEKGSTPSV